MKNWESPFLIPNSSFLILHFIFQYLCIMIFSVFIILALALYFVIPKSTALHEILRLPAYNFKAQTAPRDNMLMEKLMLQLLESIKLM